MTIRYLNQGFTTPLATGNGKLSITPPSGQFWIPRLVRVGVTFPAIPFFPNNHQQYYCSLFHGGTGDVGVDAFIDGTGNGSGDITSILNGTLIQMGEYLTVDWNVLDLTGTTAATPDPTAVGFMQVVGLTADTIAEATAILATAVPGPPFRTPLPTTFDTPQAASSSSLFIFNNPGQNNTVFLIGAAVLYIYNVNILTGTTTANADGYLNPVGFPNFKFAYYNPGSTALAVPVVWNFNGMRLTSNSGLQWIQQGNAAANSLAYAVDIAWRAMAI